MDKNNSKTLIGALCLLVGAAETAASAEENFHLLYPVAPTPEQCCGIDSLYVCLGLLDGSTKLKSLEQEVPFGPKGVSAEDLSKACQCRGVSAM